MRQDSHARTLRRRARFEKCEDRIVFSSVPWTEIHPTPGQDLVTPLPEWGELYPANSLPGSQSTQLGDPAYVHKTYGFRGAGQTVAVIDSGIAYDHVAFGAGFGNGNQVVGGWDFTEESDPDPYDDGPAGFHGTHVAGIIASQDADRSGVAPDVDLVALRVFNDMGLGYTAWVENALQWVHDHQNDFRYPITTVNLSLGSRWNGEAPPEWATLEEELATLVDDGIFISVAAGNGFADFDRPGLAYPAASPYVVPVASVSVEGDLSAFSQRSSRAIAAPGENVTSSVPDHIFGADGLIDDWAAATGTSMAAPYLSGASVLIREAMEYVGIDSIDQNAIYGHLRDTADLIVDADTGTTYRRVNLVSAIDALIASDDLSSLPSEAHQLGSVTEAKISGQLEHPLDQDLFGFSAEIGGDFRVVPSSGTRVNVSLISADGQPVPSPQAGTYRLETGMDYLLVVGGQGTATKYELRLVPVSASPVQVDGNVIHARGTALDDVIRVSAEGPLRIEINGDVFTYPDVVSWRLDISGGGGFDRLSLVGSTGDDEIVFRQQQVQMVGANYHLSATGFQSIEADAVTGGDDVARFHDSPDDDEFLSAPTQSLLRGEGFSNKAIGFDRAYAYATAGGKDDVARFYDSPGNDEFLSAPSDSVLRGPQYYNKAIGFDRAYAYATAGGGDDVARFFDSPGNDEFLSAPSESLLRGPRFYNKAIGFDRAYAYATAGNDDVARFYDSPGNDEFLSAPTDSVLRGPRFYNKAIGFDRAYAYATGGNDDVARFYDSPGNDEFLSAPTDSVLRGPQYYNKAIGFDRAYAYATGGNDDIARFYDSPGNDEFRSAPAESVLRGPQFYNKALGFDRAYAYATAGSDDVARFYDSPGSDTFQGGPELTSLRGNGYFNKAHQFDRVYAYASPGAVDIARLSGSAGSDRFTAWADRQIIRADGLYIDVRGFNKTYVNSIGSQSDFAYLHDSPANDRFTAWSDMAVWKTDWSAIEIHGFSHISVTASSGGFDTTRFEFADAPIQFFGQGNLALGIDADTRYDLRGFHRVTLNVEESNLTAFYLATVDYLFEQIGAR